MASRWSWKRRLARTRCADLPILLGRSIAGDAGRRCRGARASGGAFRGGAPAASLGMALPAEGAGDGRGLLAARDGFDSGIVLFSPGGAAFFLVQAGAAAAVGLLSHGES